jgi:hypothetical protein
VGERHEDVVVETALPRPPLGVDGLDRSEQDQRLVDEMAAEVEQGAAAGRRGTGVGVEPLEAGLEPGHGAQRPAVDQGPDGAEVRVLPSVLVRRQHEAGALRQLHRSAGGRGVVRERLVAHHGEAQPQRLVGELGVRGGRSGDGHSLGPGRRELLQRAEQGDPRVLPLDERPPLGGRRHDPEKLALGCRGQQGRVEPASAEAVPDEPDADRFHLAIMSCPPHLG